MSATHTTVNGPYVTRTRELLAAYFDLHTDAGPLHARCVAEMGRCFLAGDDVPPYQLITPGLLRYMVRVESPGSPKLDDPRALAPQDRSAAWSVLCDQLDHWHDLDAQQRLRLLRVLFKLGFWSTVVDITAEPAEGEIPTRRQFHYLRTMALEKTEGRDTDALPCNLVHDIADAARNEATATQTRVAAAVRLLVHYVRHAQHGRSDAQYWGEFAQSIFDSSSASSIHPLVRSVYWRGLSFLPFLQRDSTETYRMLAEAQDAADDAISKSAPDRPFLALENNYILSITHARAASAFGHLDVAETHHRTLVELDPLGCHGHVLLADFLCSVGRQREAERSYRHAATLGAPQTGYALARAAVVGL